MPVNIQFRGPAVFVSRNPLVPEVLIPNGERTIRYKGVPNMHPDGKQARPHFARLIVSEVGSTRIAIRASLLGRRVVLREGGHSGGCRAGSGFEYQPPLNRAVNKGDACDLQLMTPQPSDFGVRLAATVELKSGTMSAGRFSEVKSQLPGNGKPPEAFPIELIWESETDDPVLEIWNADGTHFLTTQLGPDQCVAIYNFDKEDCDFDDLTQPEHDPMVDDLDFRWVYQLLNAPRGMTIEKWVQTCPGRLAVPKAVEYVEVSDLRELRSPPISTCYPTTWEP